MRFPRFTILSVSCSAQQTTENVSFRLPDEPSNPKLSRSKILDSEISSLGTDAKQSLGVVSWSVRHSRYVFREQVHEQFQRSSGWMFVWSTSSLIINHYRITQLNLTISCHMTQ